MRTLLVDNYDSFTYNLVHLIADALGQAPDVVCNDKLSWEEFLAGGYEAVVISPGPGHPARPADFHICQRIIEEFDGPVLGVCLGHQGIGHFAGGEVDLAPTPMHGRVSMVRHTGEGLLAGVPQDFEVVRYHSLLVTDPGPNIEITAQTQDGLAMALRHKTLPRWGVQFHPESISSQYGVEIIRNFRRLALAHNARVGRKAPVAEAEPAPKPEAKRKPKSPPLKLYWREIADWVDPEVSFATLFACSDSSFWLDGMLTADGMGRFGYMGDAEGPHSETIAYDVRERLLEAKRAGVDWIEQNSVFDYLNERLRDGGMDQPAGYLPPFCGGYVGYLGYELKEDCGGHKGPRSDMPDAWMLFADRFVVFDNVERRMWAVCLDLPEESERAGAWLDATVARLVALKGEALPAPKPVSPMEFKPSQTREEYARSIETSKREIRHGETYEVCMTNQFVAEGKLDPFNAYRVLRAVNPAPYASYLKFGESAVLSCSPERFIKVTGDGVVESKPIKGTAKRGASPEEDFQIAEALRTSEKDRSENLMIVDLLRNDLGRVCKLGSVHVPKLFAIESYQTVHQLVSTIRGTLKRDNTSVDCIRAAFPGGSMTGAPKVRTMEIIDRLEDNARGVYSGSIGFISLTGAVDLNIVIRTAVLHNDTVRIGAGGAIIDLSDVQGECDEVWLKLRALLMGFNSLELSAKNWKSPTAPALPQPVAAEAGVLEQVRSDIDRIDAELLALMAKRFEVTKRAAEHKMKHGMTMMQPERVRAVLDRLADKAAAAGMPGDFARGVWRSIIQEACRREIAMRADSGGASACEAKAALLQDSVVGYGVTRIEVADVEHAVDSLCSGFGFRSERAPYRRADGRMLAVVAAGPIRLALVSAAKADAVHAGEPREVVVEVRGLGLLDQDLRERGAPIAGARQRSEDGESLVADLGEENVRLVFFEPANDSLELADIAKIPAE